jgi:kexin
MRISSLWLVLAGACSIRAKTSHRSNRDYDRFDYYAVHLHPSASAYDVARHLGLDYDGRLNILEDHHVFRSLKHSNDIVRDAMQELKRRRRRKRELEEPHLLETVLYSHKQILRKRLFKRGPVSLLPAPAFTARSEAAIAQRSRLAERLAIQDPIFNQQWHVYNTVEVGNDLNVTGLWVQGITGKGAVVCIVDDGLDMDSEDLKPNYFAAGSYDFNDGSDQPKPRLDDDLHGTRCAGEVAAARNDVCGVGVAYDAKISGIRILSKPIGDLDEAEAVMYGFQHNDIYSCSWGPPDDGKTMEAPGILIKRAMLKAVQQGRAGKGSIYVFAAGNGAAADDNCNFDGYTNSIYSITVGAIDKRNLHPHYSEKCSAQLAVTYSSGTTDSIHTTDVGANKCTSIHGGTSAAGPLAAGVFALVLQARPDITWRDMQWLTVMAAVPFYNEEPEEHWQTTAVGRKYSHQFGYGKLDGYAIVDFAKTWKLVRPQAWLLSPWIHVRHPIPQGAQGLTSTFQVTPALMQAANLDRIEHVTVTMNIQHARRGDLSVELRSPFGIVSHLSTARGMDEAPVGYVDWTFMTVAHFGESGLGNWTIVVKDEVENDKTGTFTDWRLNLFGESKDPKNQKLFPMPEEHEDDNHDVETTTAPVGTISVTAAPTSQVTHTPSGLPTRQSIAKPSDGAQTSKTAEALSPPTASATSLPADSFLPSAFPTFGLSKSTQVWVYGALSLILIFCGSLAIYFYLQRRKRLRNNPRDNYEFAMLDDQEDAEGMLSGVAGGRKGRRRAGELYDAFAGESDEELFSDDEGYRDELDNIAGEGRGGEYLNEKVPTSDSDDDGDTSSAR